MKKRTEFTTQTDYLNYLSNQTGCDFKICMSGKTKEETNWFSKRYSMLELNSYDPNDKIYLNNTKTSWVIRKEFTEQATHRTILDIEIVFDIDDEPIIETTKKILKKYKEDNPITYFTGSKSYHIHFFKRELRFDKELQKYRAKILSSNNSDSGKGSSKNMIAIEGAPHYKSGKRKKEVFLCQD